MRTPVLFLLLASGCATSQRVHGEVRTFVRHYNNVHLLPGTSGYVMIDAGLESDGPTLAEDLRRRGVDPARIEAIVLTHGHADHAGGARYFQQRFGSTVIVGQGDVDLLETGENDELCPQDATARRRLEKDRNITYAPLQPDVVLERRLDLSTVSSATGMVVPLAGHTDGSVVLLSGEVAFVGDLFRGSIVGHKAERHFYMCDLEDNDADIRALLEGPGAEATIFFPGHFGPIERSQVVKRFGG